MTLCEMYLLCTQLATWLGSSRRADIVIFVCRIGEVQEWMNVSAKADWWLWDLSPGRGEEWLVRPRWQGNMSRPPGSGVTHSSLLSARGRGSRFPPAGSAGASGGWAGSHNALRCRGTSGCLRTQETNKSNQSENTVLSSLETMKGGQAWTVAEAELGSETKQ